MITAQSSDWSVLKRWLVEQIAEAHKAMEIIGLPEKDTDILRGHIAAYRKIIAAVEPRSAEGGGGTNYTGAPS